MISKAVKKDEIIKVTVVNEVDTAAIWVLPQTDENLKTSLWGTATLSDFEADKSEQITLDSSETNGRFIVRIIDEDKAYFAVNDIYLEDGYKIQFTTDVSPFDAVIKVLNRDGDIIKEQLAFEGVLGSE